MKRILFLLAFVAITLCGMAQKLDFDGIPVNQNVDTFEAALLKKGATRENGNESNMRAYSYYHLGQGCVLGTNNIAYNTDEEIAEGIVEVVRSVQAHQPQAQIYVCSVLPRLDHGERVAPLNAAIQAALLQHHSPAHYLDLAPIAFDADGNFRRDLFSDGLHPNAEGYRVLAARMKELLHL